MTLTAGHIDDNGEETNVDLTFAEDGKAGFEAASFSIYVIYEHENDDNLQKPRKTFYFLSDHFMDYEHDAEEIHGESEGGFYESGLYEFPNEAGEMVSRQIVKNGEKLHPVVMPDNTTYGNFHGWYIVALDKEKSVAATIEHSGGTYHEGDDLPVNQLTHFVYTWSEDSSMVDAETPIAVGSEDEDVFLAPLFFNFRFVEFLNPAYGESGESIATTKIITMSSSQTAKVELSDVVAESTNEARKFYGWKYKDHTYQTRLSTGDTVEQFLTLTADDFPGDERTVKLNPVFKEVTDIHFDVEASDATPVDSISAFLYDPEVMEQERATITQLPVNTTRPGYIFDGWYARYENADGELVEQQVSMEKQSATDVSASAIITTAGERVPIEYDSGGSDVSYLFTGKLYLRHELTLYAHWRKENTADYKVVIWKQKVSDAKNAADSDKTYNYQSYTLMKNAVTDSVILDLPDYQAKGFEDLGGTGDFECFHYGRTEVVVNGVAYNGDTQREQGVVAPDGSTVVNVYYDRDLMAIQFYFRNGDAVPEGAQTTGPIYLYTAAANPSSTSTTYYGFVNGEYKELTNGGSQTTTTSTFRYKFTESTSTSGANTYYGVENHEYIVVYYNNRDGKWYKTRTGGWFSGYTYSDEYTGSTHYSRSNDNTAYNGQRYARNSDGTFTATDSTSGTLYGLRDGNYVELSVTNKTEIVWNADGTRYNGTVYTRSSTTDYTAMLIWTGLYDQTLAQNSYSWEDVNTIKWQDSSNVIQTLLEGFSSTESPYVLKSNGTLSTNVINHYKETLDGVYVDDQNDPNKKVSTHAPENSGTFNFSNKFNGFEVDSYNSGANSFNANGGTHITEGSSVSSYSFPLNVYHKRKTFRLTLANYRTTNNSGNLPHDWEIDKDIPFELPLSQVLAEYPAIMTPPARANYDFAGWYVDASCTKEMDFSTETMPAANMIIYAKWELKHYMVEIDPDGGEMQAGDIFSAYTGSGTGSEITYTRLQYGGAVQQPANITRTYLPAHNGEYVYVKVKLASSFENMAANWDNRVPEEYRCAFYCKQTELNTVYDTYFAQFSNLLTREDFLSNCVDNTQHYRKADPNELNERYTLEGWHKVNADGTTSGEKYHFGDAITKDTRIRAVWKRSGAYHLCYDPYDSRYQVGREVMMDDHLMYNMTLYDPSDPDNLSAIGSAHYRDGAQAVVLQHPTYIPNHYIFRGWQLMTYDGEGTGEFYAPGDTFTVNSDYADSHGIIRFEAAYEPESESVRIVDVVGLVLDASSAQGGYAVRGNLDIYDSSSVYADLDANQVIFKDQSNNFKVHLGNYINNFRNANGYMLVGWSDNEHYDSDNPFAAPQYAADAVIGVDRNNKENNILHAVWEPTYYLTLENHSIDYNITFNLTFSNFSGTVYCADSNSAVDAYVRHAFNTYSDQTVQVRESSGVYTVTINKAATAEAPNYIKLILPQGTTARYTVSGSIDNALNDDNAKLSDNHSEKLSVYNSGGASEQIAYRRNNNNSGSDAWRNLSGDTTKNYTVSGNMITGNTGQTVAFYTGNVDKVSVYIQALYYDIADQQWHEAVTGEGPSATLSFEDYGGLSYQSMVSNSITGLEIIKNTGTNTFSVKEEYANTAYKFIGWYDKNSAAPGDITLDGKVGLDGAGKVTGIPVPNTFKNYYALYVPKADGDLVISHDEKDTSIGYPKYMNVVAQYGNNAAVSAEEKTMITSIAAREGKVHTQVAIHVSETDPSDTLLTITLGSRSGYGSVHLNTFEGTHKLDIEAQQDNTAPVWYINANPNAGAPDYNSTEAAGEGYETKHLWYRTVTKTAAQLFEDSETVKGLKVLNPLNYYTDFERKFEFVYNYVFRDGVTPRKYLVTGSTAEHSTLEDFKHFVLENAPYVTNYGENLSWNTATINVTNLDGKGKVYATMDAAQYKNAKANVFVHSYNSDVTETWSINVGEAFPENNRPTAPLILENENKQFYRWKITEANWGNGSQDESKLVGYCYYNEFTFMIWDDYDIVPEYVDMNEDGEYHRYYPDDEKTAYVNIDFLKNTRNQWVDIDENKAIIYDENGNAKYNDALISDYSIIFIDHGLRINTNPDNYKVGLLYEVVGEVTDEGVYDETSAYINTASTPEYRERVVSAILSSSKDNGTVKATVGGEKKTKFYYSKIEPSILTHDNRIEFYRGIDNLRTSEELNPNAKYIFNVYAYMQTPDTNIHICEEPVKVQLFDLATRTNIISG